MTTTINMKIISPAYVLCLLGIVTGLAIASPSPAIATPNGTESP